jgi:outer membrane protein assembly factor BamB
MQRHIKISYSYLITLFLVCTSCSLLVGGDWPQGLGPSRNGIAQQEKPLQPWPENGPVTAWSHTLGSGFAGPIVVGEKVVVFHRIEDAERVEALDAKSGKVIWSQDFKAYYRGGYNPDSGPRATPVVAGNRVFVFGAASDLHCLDLATGKPKWSRTLGQDYQAPDGYFGAGSGLLVMEDHVLVNVGGIKVGIVALDIQSGKTVWEATTEKASYSSPTVLSFGGTNYAVFITRMQAIALNPLNGKLLFSTPFGKQGPTVNGATPVTIGNHVFLTASYRIGARMLELGQDGKNVEIQWSGDDIMSSQYATPLPHDGHLFGIHGREDVGVAALRCIDMTSGKVQWEKADFGVAHTILVKDKFLALNTSGELVLVNANVSRYEEVARAKVSASITRCFPALSNGYFYFRNNQGNQGKLTALKLP